MRANVCQYGFICGVQDATKGVRIDAHVCRELGVEQPAQQLRLANRRKCRMHVVPARREHAHGVLVHISGFWDATQRLKCAFESLNGHSDLAAETLRVRIHTRLRSLCSHEAQQAVKPSQADITDRRRK